MQSHLYTRMEFLKRNESWWIDPRRHQVHFWVLGIAVYWRYCVWTVYYIAYNAKHFLPNSFQVVISSKSDVVVLWMLLGQRWHHVCNTKGKANKLIDVLIIVFHILCLFCLFSFPWFHKPSQLLHMLGPYDHMGENASSRIDAGALRGIREC